MAEFPDLGKNCAICRKLDFTPFSCEICGKYFCGSHRLFHSESCNNNVQIDEFSKESEKGMKKYLCAMDGCFNKELMSVICPNCSHNFCLKHRHAEEHKCNYRPKTLVAPQKAMKSSSVETKVMQKRTSSSASIRVLTEAEKKKADRIAIMRAKSKIKNVNIPSDDILFIFVDDGSVRKPVMVSRKWSVGRCVDEIAKIRGIENNNAKYGTKMLRLYTVGGVVALRMADQIQDNVKESDDVFIRRDD